MRVCLLLKLHYPTNMAKEDCMTISGRRLCWDNYDNAFNDTLLWLLEDSSNRVSFLFICYTDLAQHFFNCGPASQKFARN